MDNASALVLNELLKAHSVDASVIRTVTSPSVTRHELTLGASTRVESVLALTKTIGYAVGSDSVRMLTPVPGRSAVGIEVPNAVRRTVTLSELKLGNSHPLTIPVGIDTDNRAVLANLGSLPHLLVAGTTGSGKSVFVNSALTTLIRRTGPEVVRLVLIDPKMVELALYADVPHLWAPVITDMTHVPHVLTELCAEMQRRYERLQAAKVRDIETYNERVAEADTLPYIVTVVDELADLMMSNKKVIEPLLVRVAQKGRAAGLHLVLATQRPSVSVVTGLIKANVPSRLAFMVASHTDSGVILDQTGAQHLTGLGDGLYLPAGAARPVRVQGAYVNTDDVETTVIGAQCRYAYVRPVVALTAPAEVVPPTPLPASKVPTHRPSARQGSQQGMNMTPVASGWTPVPETGSSRWARVRASLQR